MKTPLGMEVDFGPGHIVLDEIAAKGAQQPPSFRPMSIVATVAHPSYCWALVNYVDVSNWGVSLGKHYPCPQAVVTGVIIEHTRPVDAGPVILSFRDRDENVDSGGARKSELSPGLYR